MSLNGGGATSGGATLVPEPQLRAWIGDRLPGEGPFTVQRVTAGRSNELFRISRSGEAWVLRRPPRIANVAGAHDMAREFRIVRALEGSDVPHARAHLLCDDPDVIGAPFFVMDVVDGIRIFDGLPAGFETREGRRALGHAIFDVLADLHTLDWQAIGLDGLGRPEGFTERQVPRWLRQLATYQVRELPDLAAAGELLLQRVPQVQRTVLIHGDYGVHNILFGPGLPVELRAVLDWETATIGDPLMDAGFLLSLWLEGDEPERWGVSSLPYDVAGFPTRVEMIERYAARAGLDLADIDWYRAVAQLKIACILEGAYARYVRGDADDPGMAIFEQRVPNHAAYALAIARGDA